MSVAIAAWILHIHHQDPKDCTRMGPVLRSFVFRFMARAVCHKSQLDSGNKYADVTLTMTVEIQDTDPMNTTSNRGGMLESEVHKIRQFLEDRKRDRDVDEAMEEVEEAPLQEWKEAVIIIDKFFFRLYAIGNVLLALTFTTIMVTSVVEMPW